MKPILFKTDMVRAILEGRKTCTRRLVKQSTIQAINRWQKERPKDQPEELLDKLAAPPYYPGDVLYVRETWSTKQSSSCKMAETGACPYESCKNPPGPCFDDVYIYKATDNLPTGPGMEWKPSIHMPKEAARIFLRVTGVRAERLQDITGAGIKAEGASSKHGFGATRGAFIDLWNSTIKPAERDCYGWFANPWVWVIEFERCEKPKAEIVS